MTIAQAIAVLMVLQAFGVDQATLNKVHDILIPPVVQVAPSASPAPTPPQTQQPAQQPTQTFGVATQPATPTVDNTQATTTTPVAQVVAPVIPFKLSNAEIMYSGQYNLRIFANIPISIASTTGLTNIAIGTSTVDNGRNSYAPYWSEAPLAGVPAQHGGESRTYHATIYSQDGQTQDYDLSVPY